MNNHTKDFMKLIFYNLLVLIIPPIMKDLGIVGWTWQQCLIPFMINCMLYLIIFLVLIIFIFMKRR